jgi:hypothetical protein
LLDGLREGNLRKVLLESGCPTAQIESEVRTAIARLNEAEAA